jgi:DNA invertase Pin-like site-specific DNA recombinase
MKRVAIYARVSTDAQTVENQLRELRRITELSDWNIVATYIDHAVSGSVGRNERGQMKSLLKGVSQRQFDLVMCWSIDRLGRSLSDLLGFVEELRASKVDLYIHQQALDTSTPTGRMMFQMCGVFAEFERSILRDRIIAGQKRASASGKRIGRSPKINDAIVSDARALREKGLSIRKIALELGIGVGTVHKALAT